MLRRCAFPLFAAMLLACSPLAARTPADPVNAASTDAHRPASFFSTQPQGNFVRGKNGSMADLERIALAVEGARTPTLVGDGRLAEVALALAGQLGSNASDLSLGALAGMTRERGLINALPQVVWTSTESLKRAHTLVIERAQPLIARYESTHFGVAAEKRGLVWIVVLVLDRRPIEMEPIPTTLATTGTVRVQARLLENLTDATLVVKRPGGKVETAARNPQGSTLDHTLILHEGTWGLEIIGSGARGPSVLANMVVEVGARSTVTTPVANDIAPSTVATFTSRLEALIAAERSQQGLPSLTRDASLDSVAAAHSIDMREHRFIGHLSPTTGGPSDRVARAQVPAWELRENVALGYTPQEVHAFLMGSPAHRASILSPDTDRLGLGVIEQAARGRPSFYVTELFARRPFEITADQVLTDIAARALALRNARGLARLVPNERLNAGALAAANRFFAEPAATQEVFLQTATQAAPRPRTAKTLTARLFVGILPSSIELTDELLDPAARWIGVGIARGNHPQFGEDALAIVVFVAK